MAEKVCCVSQFLAQIFYAVLWAHIADIDIAVDFVGEDSDDGSAGKTVEDYLSTLSLGGL